MESPEFFRRNHAANSTRSNADSIQGHFHVDSSSPHRPDVLREEWQEATGKTSLLEIDGNMGLVFADLINGFGLDVDDQCRILGNDLFGEMKDFLYAPKQY